MNKNLKEWALKVWELSDWIEGTMSGGIGPSKIMVNCNVHDDSVEIEYKYPRTCGLSDVIYHVVEPDKIRTDVFRFTDDGITMNGKPFPGKYEDDPWTAAEAKLFMQEYAARVI